MLFGTDTNNKGYAGNNLPTLGLQNRVSKLLLYRYKMLMESSLFIPCEKPVATGLMN